MVITELFENFSLKIIFNLSLVNHSFFEIKSVVGCPCILLWLHSFRCFFSYTFYKSTFTCINLFKAPLVVIYKGEQFVSSRDPFFSYQCNCYVVMCDPAELEKRTVKTGREDGKWVPVKSVMEMKKFYKLPDQKVENWTSIHYVEEDEQTSKVSLRFQGH